jgi:hypothetical protein
MLVFYGLAVVMYDQLVTASGSWRAVFLPLTESVAEEAEVESQLFARANSRHQ